MTQSASAEAADRNYDAEALMIGVADICRLEGPEHFDMDAYKGSVRKETALIMKQNADLATDEINRAHLSIVASMLAVYRIGTRLSGHSEGILDEIQRVSEDSLLQKSEPYIECRFDIDISRPNESFDRVVKNFIPRGLEIFGVGSTYEEVERDENHSFVHISRCFFLDFFHRNGAPEVTQVMCALDMVWARTLDERGHNVRFERPTKMSDGDDVCRFHFYRSSV